MKKFFNEYGLVTVTITSSMITLTLLFNLFTNLELIEGLGLTQSQENLVYYDENVDIPKIDHNQFVVKGTVLDYNQAFDPFDYVFACDTKGNDITSYISVDNPVDTAIPGTYEVNFKLHFNGESIIKSSTFYVKENDGVYTISGILIDDKGNFLEDQELFIKDQNADELYFKTASDGKFIITNLLPGSYQLVLKDKVLTILIEFCDLDLGLVIF